MGLLLCSYGYAKDTGWCSRPVDLTWGSRPLRSHIKYPAYLRFAFWFITVAKLELWSSSGSPWHALQWRVAAWQRSRTCSRLAKLDPSDGQSIFEKLPETGTVPSLFHQSVGIEPRLPCTVWRVQTLSSSSMPKHISLNQHLRSGFDRFGNQQIKLWSSFWCRKEQKAVHLWRSGSCETPLQSRPWTCCQL